MISTSHTPAPAAPPAPATPPAPPSSPDWVVETENLTMVYESGSAAVRALDGVTVRIPRGQFVAVMGPSGSGKSTLLHLLGALDRPTSGSVRVNGRDLSAVDDLDRFRARELGFVFQMHNLLPMLTARENVEVPMEGIGLPGDDRRRRALLLLEMLGMESLADRLPSQLSGGQRQRVAVARALANDPSLILADEPTGNLDSTNGADLIGHLVDLTKHAGKTIVLVTHDPVVALAGERILTLRDGRLFHDEPVGETYLTQVRALADTPLGQLLFGHQR